MTGNINLHIYRIGHTTSAYHPVFTNVMSTEQHGTESAANARVAQLVSNPSQSWGPRSARSGGRPDVLDFDYKRDGKAVYAFYISKECEAYFASTPFIDLPLAGAPAGGIIKSCQTFGTEPVWASLTLNTNIDPRIMRLPIVFNFIDKSSKISPFFLEPHSKVLAAVEGHGGIHPPTASSNIDLVP